MTLNQAQLSYVAAVRQVAVARAQHAEVSTAGRLHTVILFEARAELALRYLERAEDAAAA